MPRKKFTPAPVADLLAFARELRMVEEALLRRRRELRAELEVIASDLIRLGATPERIAKIEADIAIEEATQRASEIPFPLHVQDADDPRRRSRKTRISS